MKKYYSTKYQTFKQRSLKFKIAVISTFLLGIGYYFCLPKTLFQVPYSTVLESSNGTLLSAQIASDGQWRFPEPDSIPYKFEKSIIAFEDGYYHYHMGINPISMINAFIQNQKAKKVVRGGSTITQQVIRLSRQNQPRTYWEKCKEMILATRLEFRYSKNKILKLYTAHAPFGGNIVGLEMASYRYFGLRPHQLSWSQAAAMAVLPNAPSAIYPGKNQAALLKKRNALLLKLHQQKVIDEITYQMAIQEPLPQKAFQLPQIAPHFLQTFGTKTHLNRLHSTLHDYYQIRTNEIVKQYYQQHKHNQIYNMAAVIMEVQTRKIIAYTGNTPTTKDFQKDVDIAIAPRSTGSILKPLLFTAMVDAGKILPDALTPDIPVQISGYKPENFNRSYDGAVPAKQALSRSLNIPSVLMLQEYGIPKFYHDLQSLQLNDISRGADQYGLSLILGGAESNLLDICRTYADLASTLNYFIKSNGTYRSNEIGQIAYLENQKINFGSDQFDKKLWSAGAIYETFVAMQEVNRPEEDEAWQFYESALKIAWKTGTSYGNRDAWAVGVNDKYVVGVWVGNATGEGRANLTGVTHAAPVMFDLFRILPNNSWFQKPLNDLEEVAVCAHSGFLATDDCPAIKRTISVSGKNSKLCPYHKRIHLSLDKQFQVHADCENTENMIVASWFVLPPVMEWYYRKKHYDYQDAPPFREDCQYMDGNLMDFIYPKSDAKIVLAKDFNAEIQPVIIKVAHRNKLAKINWYLDGSYLGTTQSFHDMPIIAKTGIRNLLLIDDKGNELRRRITITSDK